jgi:hypothetical protein
MNSAFKKLMNNSILQTNRRNFGKSVYLWTHMPTVAPKSGGLTQAKIPKGTPKKIEAYDDLNIE